MTSNTRRSRGSTATRVGRFLGNLLLVTVMLGATAFIVPSLLGYERYVITGGSMSGTFEVGSVAFEETVPVAELQVGDVITYLPPTSSGIPNLVTHRIASIKANKVGETVFSTKGDANAAIDPWKFQLSAPTQARVEFTVPLVGHAFLALADRDTRVLLIGIPAGLVALLSLLELFRGLRPGKRKSDPLHIPAQRHWTEAYPLSHPAGA